MAASPQTDDKSDQQKEALMRVRLQNYNPRTEDLKKYCEDAPDPEEFLHQLMEAHEQRIKDTNRKFADPALDSDNLTPRKANWDIKRSLAPKLQRLERRTHHAIIRIAQQKAKDAHQLTAPQSPPSSSDEDN